MFGADAVRCMRRDNGGGPPPVLNPDFVLNIDMSLGRADKTTRFRLRQPYDITIDWGDGTAPESLSSTGTSLTNKTHTYPDTGQYTITITGSLTALVGELFSTYDYRYCWVEVISFGETMKNFSSVMRDAINLHTVCPQIYSGVTDMSLAFQNCASFAGDLSAWDTSSVTDMNQMFNGATIFNNDLSGWCVTNITSLPGSFATGSALAPEHYPIWGTCP